MRCSRARRLIARRVVGDMPPGRHAAFENHLEKCPGCTAAMIAQDRITGDLAALRRVAPPKIDVTRRVLHKIAALEPLARDERPRPFTIVLATGIAAVLLLLVVVTAPDRPTLDSIVGAGQVFGAFATRLVILLLALACWLARCLLGILGVVSDVIRVTYPVTRMVACMSMVIVVTMIIVIVGREMLGAPRPVSCHGGSR